MTSRFISVLLIVGGVVIVAGSAPLPKNFIVFTDYTGQVAPRLVLFRIVQLTPFFPLVCGIVRLTTRIRLSRALATVLACIIFCIGILFTLLGAGLSGPGFVLMVLQGSANSLAVASALLLLVERPSPRLRTMLALTGLAIAVAASVWSLQAVYSVMNQAKDTADGSPFCIAQHHDSAPIESLSELRGFRFYTTATGYKDSSTEYFHGVLAVQADGTRYYNWSPRNQRFDLIEEAMRVSVRDVCKPKADFLTTLSII